MTPCSRARQNEGSRSSTSGVVSTSTSSGRRQERRPRNELLVDGLRDARRARSGCARRRRSARRRAASGGTDETGSRASTPRTARSAARSAACRRSSRAAPAASRDFPMPGSPTSSTSVPKPIRTGATDAPRALPARARGRRTEASRPSGSRSSRSWCRSSPSTNAWTGSLFPFTVNGSSSVDSNDAPPRVNAPAETQISSSRRGP